jgi:hypothetical protein
MTRTLALVLLVLPMMANAVVYDCTVSRKLNATTTYTKEQLEKGQFSVLIEEDGSAAFLSRCSYSSIEKAKTCDRYKVDRVERDSHVNIKKYYHFSSQFDVQLYSDLSFVENNGRGDLAYGVCRVKAP